MSDPMPGLGRTFSIRALVGRFLADDRGARTLQLAGIVRFALIFIQGVVLVKAGVPIKLVGQIEFVFFVANFLMFAWQSGGQNALLSWVPRPGEAQLSIRRLAATFITMHVFAAIAAIVLVVAGTLKGETGYGSEYSFRLVLLLAAYVFFTLPTSPIIYNYLLRDRYRRIIAYILVNYLFQVGVVLTAILTGQGLENMVIYLLCYAILRWLFTVIDGKWLEEGVPAMPVIRAFAVFSVPLVLHAFNSGLMDYVDGWIVSGYFGDESFALYRYGAKELPLNTLLIGGLMTGLIPRFSATGAVVNGVIRSEISRLINVLFPLNCVLILLSPILYELVYAEEFVISARIFNIYALTLLSRVIVNQVFLYVARKTWLLALSTVGEIIVNIALSLVLLEHIGLIGIPLATVIAYALHKGFIFAYVHYGMRVRTSQYFPVWRYTIALLFMVLSFAAAELIYFS